MEETINSNRIQIHEITKVSPPSSDSSNSSFTLPLTYFDTYFLKFHPGKCLLFYEIKDLTCDVFNSVIISKLKQSLSLTLLHYLPLAGHLMWPSDAAKPAIYYFFPDDGVSVTVATAAHDDGFNLLDLSSNGIREAVLFRPLVPQLLILDDKAAVIAVQITLFPNQGFSIAITSHHAVFDGKSALMFIKSWAYMCKQLVQQQEQNPSLLPELTPCFDRTLIKDPKGIDMVYAKHWMMEDSTNTCTRSFNVMNFNPGDENPTNFVRMAFELTREDIKKLRDKVLTTTSKDHLQLSTYVLTCAYVYVCLVKAMGKEGNSTIGFRVGADCRNRLEPPLPVNYFGNCVSGFGLAAKASDFMKEDGIAIVAEKLVDLIKGIKGEAIVGSEEKIVNLLTALKGVRTGLPGISGSNRFDFYESDFGWGKPKKVEIMSVDVWRSISLVEGRNGGGGGGVEIGVVMEKQQMEVFASLFVNGLKDPQEMSRLRSQ